LQFHPNLTIIATKEVARLTSSGSGGTKWRH
jgi:hypothetical protein